MDVYGLKYPGSKWQKHVILWNEPALRPYLPETLLFNEGNLLALLRKYPAVYIKPNFGTGGKGVIKVARSGSKFKVQTASQKAELPLHLVHGFIKKRNSKTRCIVQQGIDLATIDGKPVDFRVLLLKPETEWKLMGIMGKVAMKNRIVTNHCRGGRSILLKEALFRSLNLKENASEYMAKGMESLGLRIAAALQNKFWLINELGLDIAVDNQKKLWLIEANTRPHYELFRDHENPDLYNNIERTIRFLRQPKKAG